MALTWDDVRDFGLTLPDTEETTSYGTPALTVKGRTFVRLRPEDDSLVVLCSALEKEALLTSGDPAMFTTPHYDGHDLILVRLDEAALDDDITELVSEAWRIAEAKGPGRQTDPAAQ